MKFLLGWELEYQNNYFNVELKTALDVDAYNHWVESKKVELMSGKLTDVHGWTALFVLPDDRTTEEIKHRCSDKELLQKLCRKHRTDLLTWDTPTKLVFLEYFTGFGKNVLVKEVLAKYPERVEKILHSHVITYLSAPYSCYKNKEPSLKLPNSCTWCDDGSVDGGEIKLKTPSTFVQASKALVELENNHKFEDLQVDNRCSFHVHLSEANMVRRYNQDMQVAMIQYLYDHLDKVPKSVLHRWSSENKIAKIRYFSLDCTADKYNFIAYRHYDTWEFRCFGNIQNAEEGRICMRLAMAAYKWACKYKGTNKIMDFIPLTKAVDKLLGLDTEHNTNIA